MKLYEKNVRLLRPKMEGYLVTEDEIFHYGKVSTLRADCAVLTMFT